MWYLYTILPPPFNQRSKIKVIPCTSNKICCEYMLQCFRLCATSEISMALIFTHWNEKNPLWLSSKSHFFFSYSESCLPVKDALCLQVNGNYSGDTEKFRRSQKMHIFAIQVLWNATKVIVKDIHFSIHTTWTMSGFFLFWNQRCTRYKTTCNS